VLWHCGTVAIRGLHSRQHTSQCGTVATIVPASYLGVAAQSIVQSRRTNESHSIHLAALHGGKNTSGGHYVCHVKKEGRWCIFNDEKVAERMASRPPALWAQSEC
jgi:ubiquitin C-terminal hydrolase